MAGKMEAGRLKVSAAQGGKDEGQSVAEGKVLGSGRLVRNQR